MADNYEQQTFEFAQRKTIKGYPELHWTGKRPFKSTVYYPAQLKESYGEGKPFTDENGKTQTWLNKIFWGDNLQVMSHLLRDFRGKVDLIYIDPPFDSKADYKKKIQLKGKTVFNDKSTFEEKQYGDIWTNDEYLQFMYERIILLKELLSDRGSIYLHCDWHKSHHLRYLLDEIFGQNNMLNEIIRKYSVGGKGDGFFARKHDTIFFYAKNSDKIIFNADEIKLPFTPHKQDKSGTNYGGRMGIDENGRPYVEKWGTGKKKLYRYYLDVGKIPEDVWEIEDDIEYNTQIFEIQKQFKRVIGNGFLNEDVWESQTIQSAAKERTDYPTQKAESLLERIIKASSNEGDLVFDCFMGSGTTQAVAMKLGRRFIGADINLGAVQTTTNRLLKIMTETTAPSFIDDKTIYTGFDVYNVNNYEIFRNPLEARSILLQALEVEPYESSSVYDGEKDGRMVKIMPADVNRIATKADLSGFIANLPYKTFERRKEENPNEPVLKLTIVCMGHEPDLAAEIRRSLSSYKVDIEVVDILLDRKDLQFKRDSQGEIAIENGNLVIKNFYPLNLMQKLSMQRENVDEWRQLVESILVDFNYDGAVLSPTVIDTPNKNEFVKGVYEIPENAGKIRVKITDLLSESLELETEVK